MKRVGNKRDAAITRVAELVQPVDHVAIIVAGGFMMVGHDEAACEHQIVWVRCGHCGALFCGEFVYFSGVYAVVQLVDDFNCERGIINGSDAGFGADVSNTV